MTENKRFPYNIKFLTSQKDIHIKRKKKKTKSISVTGKYLIVKIIQLNTNITIIIKRKKKKRPDFKILLNQSNILTKIVQ